MDSLVRLLSAVAQSSAPSAALHSSVREDDFLAGYEHILSRNDAGKESSGKTIQDVPGFSFSSPPPGRVLMLSLL